MKKLLAMVLALAMAVSMVACGNAEKTVDIHAKSEGVMTYEEYAAAALDSEVVIEAFVQAKQSWWEDKATVYAQDKDGAYFLYNMACSEEDYAKLTKGTKIKVKGYKAEWSGEVEIMDATITILEGSYIATEALDVTALMGTDALAEKMNMKVAVKGMTVEASKDKDGNDVPFLYKWDGSGSQGDDIYFNVSVNGNTYTFTVNAYMIGNEATYKAVEALKIGDKIDVEGFLYWYNGAQPHVTAVAPAK